MARGFESKAVADQQEEAENRRSRRGSDGPDPAQVAKRRKLELARADVARRLSVTSAEAHRAMLKRALDAIAKELAALD